MQQVSKFPKWGTIRMMWNSWNFPSNQRNFLQGWVQSECGHPKSLFKAFYNYCFSLYQFSSSWKISKNRTQLKWEDCCSCKAITSNKRHNSCAHQGLQAYGRHYWTILPVKFFCSTFPPPVFSCWIHYLVLFHNQSMIAKCFDISKKLFREEPLLWKPGWPP